MADKDTPQDDSLELKKRARRRLVGAVALALAAVVILPMVMDSEPRPAGQDIQVRIPAQDGADAPLVASPTKRAAPTAAPVAAAVEPPVSAPSSPSTSAVVPDAAKVPDATKPVEKPVEKSGDKPVDKPAPEKSVEHAPAKPASKNEQAKAEEARATAALEGKAAPSASGAWVVQLGAYQNAGNVKLLIAKMKEMGVPAYTEKLDSPQGPRVRVRAGPFASKDAAEKAQAKIRKIGVDGPVAPK